ncbi:protein cholesin isoform 1-T2 [Hipposideros larvatus]
MAKQKRKVTEVTGKKNKKLKKASAEEILLAPDATQGTKEARPEACAWTLGPRRVGARFPEGPSESRSPCVWSPAPPSWVACRGGRAGEGCVVSVLVWWCWTVGLHVLHGNGTCSWLGRRTPAMPCRVASPDVPFKTTSMFTASKKWELPTCHPWMEGHTKGSIRTVECDSATKGGGALTPHSLDEPGRHVVRGAGRRGPQMSPLT